MKRTLVAAAAAAVVMGLAADASAHERPRSSSRWSIDGRGASVVVELAASDAALVEAAGLDLGLYLPAHLGLHVARDRCALVAGSVRELPGTASTRRFAFSLSCAPRASTLRIEADVMVELVPGHVHLASVYAFGDQQYFVFGADRRVQTWSAPARASFFRLGAEHVAGGWDHLFFVLLLVALARTPRRALGWVTGFSIGHAVSLVAVALGWVAVDGAMVELAIALSIALVAVELAWPGARDTRTRCLVAAALAFVTLILAGAPAAFVVLGVTSIGLSLGELAPARPWARLGFSLLFGLVHGLGFASGLLPLLPRGELFAPLLTFNLGVEAAQLACAGLFFVLVFLLRRLVGGISDIVLATAGLAASCYWLVVRALSF